jgi:hypothetical protein
LLELGVEAKEYNTYRHGFTKFVVTGETTPEIQFFSENRGNTQTFPERSMLVVDGTALSIIDFDTKSLWMRFMLGSGNSITDAEIRPKGCNGVIYVPTSGGLLAFDFPNDSIYKYTDGNIKVSMDSISLRNTTQVFKNYMTSAGTLLSNSVNDVACKSISGQVYIALATDEGVCLKRPLTAGVYNCTQAELPVNIVEFSESDSLYWAGYDF